jgi:phage tail sheath gpL-like
MAISSAVDASAVARVVGIKTAFKDLRGGGALFLPQRIVVIGQGNTAATYDTTKRQVTSANEAANLYGYGSPIHLAVKQLFPTNGDGVGTIPVTVYPLDDDASGVAAAGDITPSGSATGAASFRVYVNNIASEDFVVASGDNVAAITAAITAAVNAVLDMPVIAVDNSTDVGLTAKWKGTSGNDLTVEVVATSEDNSGVSYAVTQPVGGLVNPDVQTALDQVGNVWESMALNCLDIADTDALDAYSTFGEGRWGALVRKPLVVFTGNTATTVTAATTISDARKTDRTNSQLVAPGSDDLPFVVAARQLARIAKVANNNPPQDYGSQAATGLTAGADGDQWTYADRDVAVKKGSSTVEVKDSVVNISDVVTFYHPSGDPIPAYRYVCDIVKLQNIIFNLDLIFAVPEWDGAPLIPDDQPTVNRSAKKPKTAVAAVCALLDSLGLNAIISDPATAKENTFAAINDQNPKRLDVATTVQLSGNTNIISVDLNFGFYFGTATVVA